jgi:FtsH-binding integral membrane protein
MLFSARLLFPPRPQITKKLLASPLEACFVERMPRIPVAMSALMLVFVHTLCYGLTFVSADGSSSSGSSSSSGDPTDSNIAAAVGACIGVVFLLGFYIFLERRYPNAAVGFQ